MNSSSWPRWLAYGVFALTSLLFVELGCRKQILHPLGSDLIVYLHAGQLMLAGQDLYHIADASVRIGCSFQESAVQTRRLRKEGE